jgi:phosphoribosylanthranilate isomerase
VLIKICGITRLEDARAAVADGADALGFVFWPGSPRCITPGAVRTIVDELPASVMYVGVFVNQPLEEVNGAAELAGLTHVQLHGDETTEFARGVERPVIRAITLPSDGFADGWPAETTWLVDAHDRVRRGGTGTRADWDAAAELARRRRVILAGGLTPENVAEAIARVRPFGIDVSSGVEQAPGMKDPVRLAALFRAARSVTGAATQARPLGRAKTQTRDR